MTQSERMNKLDRTIGSLGIVALRAEKKDRLWIIVIKANDVTATATGVRFSFALAKAINRLYALRSESVDALMS